MTPQQKLNWQFIYTSLQNNIAVVLLFVLESKGSSPGRQGFFMAVNSKKEMEGSIGGGIMEHKLVALAKEHLKDGKEINSIKKQLHHKAAAANQSGMICSGEQTILLYSIKKEEQAAIEKISNNTASMLILSPKGIVAEDQSAIDAFEYNFTNENDWLYKEKITPKYQLHIIGGGHCALALSKLMSGMDFFITVYDTREKLSTLQKNNCAHKIILLHDYADLKNIFKEEVNCYVIIMTLGYRTDAIAFEALLEKEFAYLKMLGSKQKLKTLYQEYIEKGINKNKMQCLLQPAGIAIHSQLPEEIAISIAAEIIAEKNKLNT